MSELTEGGAAPTGGASASLSALLDDVVCPCSAGLGRPMSVNEMGVVKSLEEGDETIKVRLRLTDPTCIFGLAIADAVTNALEAEDRGHRRTEVEFELCEEPWSEEELSGAGRSRLIALRRGDR